MDKKKKLMPTVLYPDGYIYYKKHTYTKNNGNLITYLRCENKNCSGTAQIIHGRDFKSMKNHNHQTNDDFKESSRFRKKLLKAMSTGIGTPKEIYDSVALKNPTAAETLPYKIMRRTMNNWKNKHGLKNPKCLGQCELIMGTRKWQKLLKFKLDGKLRKLSFFQFQHDNNNASIVLTDKYLIKKLECCTIFSIDATFETTPSIENASQLLTIMGKYKEKFIPIIWALMPNKFGKTYVQIFEFIKQKIMINLEPLQCICDFETGLHNAIRTVFKNCHITGCYFHFIQSLRKRARRLKIFENTKHDLKLHSKTLILFRKICNLAYLPTKLISIEFYKLLHEAQKNELLYKYFMAFFRYFEKYWLNIVDTQIYSIYRLKDSTNNSQERYHKFLKIKMGSHPTLPNFILKLIEIIKINHIELKQIDKGYGKNIVHKRNMNSSFKNWLWEDNEGGWATLEKNLQMSTSEKEQTKHLDNFIKVSVLKDKNIISKIQRMLKNKEILFEFIHSSKIRRITHGIDKHLFMLRGTADQNIL